MSGRVLRVASRIVFVICGLATLLTGFLYLMMRGEDLPIASEWVIFAIPLALIGGFSVIIAFLPRAWIAKACKRERDDGRLFSTPLKMLGGFAGVFYLIAVGVYFAPRTWNLNPQVMLALCPLYLVRMTLDPSPLQVFPLLAPMNAAVYGSLGVMLGYASLAFRK
jgi:cellobiose-specific phosphotransferase system component IIC